MKPCGCPTCAHKAQIEHTFAEAFRLVHQAPALAVGFQNVERPGAFGLVINEAVPELQGASSPAVRDNYGVFI